MLAEFKTEQGARFWHVYEYVAGKWYEQEYGQVEMAARWYHPAMIAMERFAAGRPMFEETN